MRDTSSRVGQHVEGLDQVGEPRAVGLAPRRLEREAEAAARERAPGQRRHVALHALIEDAVVQRAPGGRR